MTPPTAHRGSGVDAARRGATAGRVALVTNIPTPYRVPLFNVLSERLSESGLQLRVYFCARTYARRAWADPLSEARFENEVVRSLVFQRGERAVMLPVDLLGRLRAYQPDVVIVGGMSIAALLVSAFSRAHRTPYVVWSGEVAASASSRSWVKRKLRERLSRDASAFVVYGSAAGAYVSSLAPDVPVFPAWNTVDVGHYQRESAVRGGGVRQDSLYGGPENAIHVLAVGYLYARKGLDRLVRAIARVNSARDRVVMLHLVGDGPERARLEALVAELGLAERVHFWGNRPKAELPTFYSHADIFAFPTLFDVWGLVLVEAMASGLPVISSPWAGATADLVEDAVTGLVVDPEDVEALASAVTRLVDDDGLRHELGKNGADFVMERLTLERSADGFACAIEAVT